MTDIQSADPKGLIRESYNIAGITPDECRSIFIDWALSVPIAADMPQAISVLLASYAQANPDHPMNDILAAGLTQAPIAVRRGGARR